MSKRKKVSFIRVSYIRYGLFLIEFIKTIPYKTNKYHITPVRLDRFLNYANEAMEVYPYIESGRINLEIFPL